MNETHIRDVNKTFCLYCIDRFVHCAVCIQLYLIVIPVAYITIYQKQLVFFKNITILTKSIHCILTERYLTLETNTLKVSRARLFSVLEVPSLVTFSVCIVENV